VNDTAHLGQLVVGESFLLHFKHIANLLLFFYFSL